MMKKVVVNPRYQNLQAYIEAIPVTFDSLGNLLYDKRNVIREDTIDGIRMVIKSFKRIYLPNRIRYTYWHASKAARAYTNANILIENGFNTPTPIAYIEVFDKGLLSAMYFVCEHTPLQSLQVINSFTPAETEKVLTGFTHFTYQLHRKKIYHIDYNITNILFEKSGDVYTFSLIDNNRMGFGNIDFIKGLKNFRLLKITPEQRTIVGKEYARLWGINPAVGAAKLMAFSEANVRQRNAQKSLKKLLKPFKGKWA